MEEDDLFEAEPNMDAEGVAYAEDMDEEDFVDETTGTIVGFVQERFSKAETARYTDEQRWIQAYRNYRGLYGPDVKFTSAEKSQIFVKVTKTKVLAAYGQIVDVLFGANKFPITIDPTTLPEGVADSVHFETDPMAQQSETSAQLDPEMT